MGILIVCISCVSLSTYGWCTILPVALCLCRWNDVYHCMVPQASWCLRKQVWWELWWSKRLTWYSYLCDYTWQWLFNYVLNECYIDDMLLDINNSLSNNPLSHVQLGLKTSQYHLSCKSYNGNHWGWLLLSRVHKKIRVCNCVSTYV